MKLGHHISVTGITSSCVLRIKSYLHLCDSSFYDVSKYYWTCGAGNHISKDCRNPAPGHKADATFKNRMGGSTAFCQIIEWQPQEHLDLKQQSPVKINPVSVCSTPIISNVTRSKMTAKNWSGASDHYVKPSDKLCLRNLWKFNGNPVHQPDATTLQPSHKGELPLPTSFSATTRLYSSLSVLQNSSLKLSLLF